MAYRFLSVPTFRVRRSGRVIAIREPGATAGEVAVEGGLIDLDAASGACFWVETQA